jgi:hypothetical protein
LQQPPEKAESLFLTLLDTFEFNSIGVKLRAIILTVEVEAAAHWIPHFLMKAKQSNEFPGRGPWGLRAISQHHQRAGRRPNQDSITDIFVILIDVGFRRSRAADLATGPDAKGRKQYR